MKLLKPFYFDEFECVGGKCKDTCCVGWNIEIDKMSYEKYQQVKGEFGERLKRSIASGDTNQFILDENKRCPFLNKEQLCDIYINIGEDKLCNTCKTYPRITRKYDDIIEQLLTLSCPEVAKILVSHKNPIDFCFGEFNGNNQDMINVDKVDLFNALIDGRGLSVDLMQTDKIPLWKRIFICLNIANKIQIHIDNDEVNKIQKILEQFQDEEYIMAYVDALEQFSCNNELKLFQYRAIINIISGLNVMDPKFVEFYKETIDFLNSHCNEESENIFSYLVNKFDTYNIDSKVYENYIVYYLFHYYLSSYEEGTIYKYIVLMVDAYSIMKLFAMVRWFNNGYQLSDDALIDILYSYSRTIEHNKVGMDEIFKMIKKNGLDSMAYMATLIR